MESRVFDWDQSLSTGDAGMRRLAAHLEEKGHHVIDVSGLAPAQERDIDLIVGDRYVEVKTDTHRPVNLFIEMTAGDRPGNVFQSRADIWAYYFPKHNVCYWIPLSRLQHFVALNMSRYPLKIIYTRRGTRSWAVQGMAVPIADLIDSFVIDNILEVA